MKEITEHWNTIPFEVGEGKQQELSRYSLQGVWSAANSSGTE